MSELTFVGTSDAFGAGGRRQSAIFLRAAAGGVLVDCGATTGTGLSELGVERDEIDTILISHFHGDHFGGIPALLLAALYEDARKDPVRIAGPRGIEQRVRQLAVAMGYGLDEQDWSFPIVFQELRPNDETEVGPVRVSAFETHHSPHTHPHGLAIATGTERIVYSGDTGWFDGLPRAVGEANLFITECTYLTDKYEYHLNHGALIEHEAEFDCERIILTHLGSEMTDRRGQCHFETADDGLVVGL